MKYDVFISYSRKDTVIADKICSALERQGITYFIDRKGIGGGMEFPEVLAEAIMNSHIMLFLGSKNSYESKFTNNEVTFAFNKMSKGSIIPYIIDNSSLPYALEFTFSSINIRTIREHPIETTLMQDLCHLLKKEYIAKNSPNKKEIQESIIDNSPQSSVGEDRIIPDLISVAHVKTNIQKSTVIPITNPKVKPSSKDTNEKKIVHGSQISIKASSGRIERQDRTKNVSLYRQLGMFDKTKEIECNKKEKSGWWWKLYYFFFDFSKESVLNYLITLIALVILIMLMYYNGYFNNHPFLISEIIVTTLISYVGIRGLVNFGIPTDDSEEITTFLKGVLIVPFVVLFSPLIVTMVVAYILWLLSYHVFNYVLFHSAGVIYMYFSTACFTLISLIYTLCKRKRMHSR